VVVVVACFAVLGLPEEHRSKLGHVVEHPGDPDRCCRRHGARPASHHGGELGVRRRGQRADARGEERGIPVGVAVVVLASAAHPLAETGAVRDRGGAHGVETRGDVRFVGRTVGEAVADEADAGANGEAERLGGRAGHGNLLWFAREMSSRRAGVFERNSGGVFGGAARRDPEVCVG
jgi:hypothetical protein